MRGAGRVKVNARIIQIQPRLAKVWPGSPQTFKIESFTTIVNG